MLRLSFVREIYSITKEEVVWRAINELEVAEDYSNEYKQQLKRLVELEKKELTANFFDKIYLRRLIKEVGRSMNNTIFEYENCIKEAERLFSMRSKFKVKTCVITGNYYLG